MSYIKTFLHCFLKYNKHKLNIFQKQPFRGVLSKRCSIGGHPCQSVILINLQSKFIEITLRHRCSPVNLLHIFRTSFSKNPSGWLLLTFSSSARTSQVYRTIFLFSLSTVSTMSNKIDEPKFNLTLIQLFRLVRQCSR